jgi:hypothetical protein
MILRLRGLWPCEPRLGCPPGEMRNASRAFVAMLPTVMWRWDMADRRFWPRMVTWVATGATGSGGVFGFQFGVHLCLGWFKKPGVPPAFRAAERL